MQDKIKQILEHHVSTRPGTLLVKVTTTRYYEIPPGTSTPHDIVREQHKQRGTTNAS